VADDAKLTIDNDPPGNERLPHLLSEIARHTPSYLLISGDVTDRGGAAQWKTVLALLKPYSDRMKIILAPGNHDLSEVFAFPFEGRRMEQFIRAQHALLPALNGSDGKSLSEAVANDPFISADAEYRKANDTIRLCVDLCSSAPHLPEIDLLPSKRSDRGAGLDDILETKSRIEACYVDCIRYNPQSEKIINDVNQYWPRYIARAFPLVWIDKENGVAIFSLIFNAVSGGSSFGRNAIGHLDRAQADLGLSSSPSSLDVGSAPNVKLQDPFDPMRRDVPKIEVIGSPATHSRPIV
jgi:hypothetical protein